MPADTIVTDPAANRAADASVTIGVLVFDGVEELDFVGPWEVFTAAAQLARGGFNVVLLAEHDRPVRCAKGLRVLPERVLADAPPLDVLVVPGGQGTRREVDNAALLAWIAAVSERCAWVTSVCTGALLLHAAGPARARRVTTHHAFVAALRARGEVTVLEGVRFVRDGKLVTAAGVSAGIDMALWLVGQLRDPAFAREVQRYIEYHPAPPYTAELCRAPRWRRASVRGGRPGAARRLSGPGARPSVLAFAKDKTFIAGRSYRLSLAGTVGIQFKVGFNGPLFQGTTCGVPNGGYVGAWVTAQDF